jgi:hypothetical protein
VPEADLAGEASGLLRDPAILLVSGQSPVLRPLSFRCRSLAPRNLVQYFLGIVTDFRLYGPGFCTLAPNHESSYKDP